jgi:hypothetical protein
MERNADAYVRMTNDAFAAALVLAAIPTGMASAIGGVWLIRWLVTSLAVH